MKHFVKKRKNDFSPVTFYPLVFDVLQQLNKSSHLDGTNGISSLFFSSFFFSYSNQKSKEGNPRKNRKKSVRISMCLSVKRRKKGKNIRNFTWSQENMRKYQNLLCIYSHFINPTDPTFDHPFKPFPEKLLEQQLERDWTTWQRHKITWLQQESMAFQTMIKDSPIHDTPTKK